MENSCAARWTLNPEDLIEITPEKARDLIVKCFMEAQKEAMTAAGQRIGQGPSDLADMVVGAVRLAFREAKGDYDAPSKQSLSAVVQILGRKSAARGTPPEIIQHHQKQIGMLLRALD